MLFVTNYRVRPHMTKAEDKRLMDVFVAKGASPGEVAHYVRIDQSGGVVISDISDANEIYAFLLEFTEFMEFEITPALKIDDAVGPLLSYLGGS